MNIMSEKKLDGTYAVNIRIKTEGTSKFSATFQGMQFAFNKVKKNIIDKINNNLIVQITLAGKEDVLREIGKITDLLENPACRIARDDTTYDDFESLSDEWAERFQTDRSEMASTAVLEIEGLVLDKIKQFDMIKQIMDHLGVNYIQSELQAID